jgi:hypothetical protein
VPAKDYERASTEVARSFEIARDRGKARQSHRGGLAGKNRKDRRTQRV